MVLVAKDFGAKPAYMFALLHPERVLGVVTMGVPFIPPGPGQYQKHLPEGFYISRWRVVFHFIFLALNFRSGNYFFVSDSLLEYLETIER